MKKVDKYDMQFIHHIFNKHKIPATLILTSVLMLVVYFISNTFAAVTYGPGDTLDPAEGPGGAVVEIPVGEPGDIAGAVQFNGDPAGTFTGDATNFFWDDTNNRLGIGTASPAQLLTVNGNISVGVRSVEGGTDTYIGSTSGGGLGGNSAWILFGRDAGDDFLSFGTHTDDPGGTAGERMRINKDGNIGIGTATPTASLHAKGSSTSVSDYALKVENSTPTNLFSIHNSGQIEAGDATNINLFMGVGAGLVNTGTRNFAFGQGVLSNNTSGINNTGMGSQVLLYNTTGGYNTGYGMQALMINTTGDVNSAFGTGALQSNVSGSRNTGLGGNALTLTEGSNNTSVGAESGVTNVSGHENTFLGRSADVTVNNLFNATAIGYNAKVSASNSLVLGGIGADAVNVGIGTATPGARLHIIGSGNDNTTKSLFIEGANGVDSLIVDDNGELKIRQRFSGIDGAAIVVASELNINGQILNSPNIQNAVLGTDVEANGSSLNNVGSMNFSRTISNVRDPGLGALDFLNFQMLDTTPIFKILSTGNVGIGTATPGAKLSIVGLSTTNPGTSAGMICITTVGDLWIDDGPVFNCVDSD